MSLSIDTLKQACSIFERYVSSDDPYVFSSGYDKILVKLDREPSKEDLKELEVLGWNFDAEFSKVNTSSAAISDTKESQK